MGVDVISWHGCHVQQQMRPEEFCRWQKSRAICESVRQTVPMPPGNLTLKIPDLSGRVKKVTYSELTADIAALAAQATDCEDCFPQGGGSFSYAYVNYPLDDTAEKALFDVFTEQLGEPNSMASQLLEDYITAGQFGGQAMWAADRGEDGGLLQLRSALLTSVGSRRITSTEVLDVVFRNAEGIEQLTAAGAFMLEFRRQALETSAWAQSRSVRQVAFLGELFARTFLQSSQGVPACAVYFYA